MVSCSHCGQKIFDLIGKVEIKKIKTLYKQQFIKKEH